MVLLGFMIWFLLGIVLLIWVHPWFLLGIVLLIWVHSWFLLGIVLLIWVHSWFLLGIAIKTRGELRCSGRVSSFSYDTRRGIVKRTVGDRVTHLSSLLVFIWDRVAHLSSPLVFIGVRVTQSVVFVAGAIDIINPSLPELHVGHLQELDDRISSICLSKASAE
jgi:hypothetical protein